MRVFVSFIFNFMYELSPLLMQQISALSQENQVQFATHFGNVKKDGGTALVCAIFGVYHFYIGEIGKGILLILSCFVCVGAIWWFIVLLNAKKGVIAFNDKKATEILALLK